ncbi:MAG: hypothetical protein NTZ56_16720 [Acidobacteria bacterium]|nr:hypothetical protein [Acidobacteriota bacterium]
MELLDEQAKAFYELRFRAQFLESKAASFQDLFVAIMSKAHPGDFIPCRPWGNVGDRKNDGYLKSERTLFQVYAPNELRMAETVNKVETDFSEALPYWRDHFDTWVFVHNAHGGLPPDVIAKLLELERANPSMKVTHWGFEELVLRLRLLSSEALQSLFGSLPPGPATKKVSAARAKAKQAQELVRSGKHTEAITELSEALAIARSEANEEEEVELLCSLAILSSDRRGRGDRQHYFAQAEKKVAKLKSAAAKVIYLRARAGSLQEACDVAGAESALMEAVQYCTSESDDAKGNLATQGCIVRSTLVHLLCAQKRFAEAKPILAECEAHARSNKDSAEGELFQAAMEAGIHFALDTEDAEGAIARIEELEQFATTLRLANRIGGDLINMANHAAHRRAYPAALVAAQASIRLGRRSHDPSAHRFLVGALYTEAMIIYKSGDDVTALGKAEALIDICHDPEDANVKQAAQHLIAEIRRCAGDSQSAVDLARQALEGTRGGPEEVGFTKLALARALNDNGQAEEALKQAKEGWNLVEPCNIPDLARADFLSHVANYASQLGAEADMNAAVNAIKHLPDDHTEVKNDKDRALARVDANLQLRHRFLGILQESEPANVAGTAKCTSLLEANALVVHPLLRLWDEAPAESIAGLYDFWGRGNFERMLLNTRSFPQSFNVTLEVRNLEDVKRAVRLWGLYADFLILLWKGPTQNGLAILPFPEDYEEPGGWGYIIAAGSVLKKEGSETKWYPAMGHLSIFPEEVAILLSTELRPFLQSGRLILVPAVGAGCINPGHGPFEQLLAEAANAIPCIRWKTAGTPIGLFPHSPDAPFELLADLAESESARLRKLRLLLLKRSRELRPGGAVGLAAKELSLEINDTLRDLVDWRDRVARQRGLERAEVPLVGKTAPFKASGRKLTLEAPDTPFAPLFVLQSLGYGWRVDGPQIPSFPPRFQPEKGDVVGAWLAPASPGWTIPTVYAENSGE